MSKNRKVTCVIGCGNVTRAFLDGFRVLKESGLDILDVAGACDIDSAKAEEFATKAGSIYGKKPAVYVDNDLMLKEVQPEIALVCTPVYLHHGQSIACMEAGAHVLVEKPFAATLKAGHNTIEVAKRVGKTLTVGHKRRYAVGTRVMNWAILEERLIGEPRFFVHTFTSYHAGNPKKELGAMRPSDDAFYQKQPLRWQQNKLTAGGGGLLDMGVHVTDIMLKVFGELATAYAKVDALIKLEFLDNEGKTVKGTTEDTWMALLSFSSGLTGSWILSSAAPGYEFRHTTYYGSEGSLYNEQFYTDTVLELERWDKTKVSASELRDRFLKSLSEEQKEKFFPRGITHPNALEVLELVRAAEEGREPEVTALDALKAQAVCEAVYESAWCGEVVSFKDVIEGKVEGYQKEINEFLGL